MQTDYNWQYIHTWVKTSSHVNKSKLTVNDERSFMQFKWTSGQLKIMSSVPEYFAERSVWWEESMKYIVVVVVVVVVYDEEWRMAWTDTHVVCRCSDVRRWPYRGRCAEITAHIRCRRVTSLCARQTSASQEDHQRPSRLVQGRLRPVRRRRPGGQHNTFFTFNFSMLVDKFHSCYNEYMELLLDNMRVTPQLNLLAEIRVVC